ncbi:MAG: sugar phosphate isomerase/epimerase [Paracoccaceae bacterium]
MTTHAYQLYCSRKFPPLGDTLKMLSEAGFTAVEGYGGLLEDAEALKSGLKDSGLHMVSCHVGLDQMETKADMVMGLARDLNIQNIYVPFVMPDDRPTDAAGWRAFAARVAKAGQPVRDAGLTFGWHNHDFELAKLDSAETPLDILAQTDGLTLELDLGWVARAGEDPVAWIEKHADKITAAHIKDVAPAGENADEDGWADVGHGTQDWPAITKALTAAGVDLYVTEHDNPADHQRFATRSLSTMKTF